MTDSEDINTLLRQILDELIAMRVESERRSALRGERAKALAESRPSVAESRMTIPLLDAIRILAVSRAMLDEMLAENSLEDPLPA